MTGSRICVAGLIILMASTMPSYAYLDPGTGMILLQAVAGGVAAVAVAWKGLRTRVKNLFLGKKVHLHDDKK